MYRAWEKRDFLLQIPTTPLSLLGALTSRYVPTDMLALLSEVAK